MELEADLTRWQQGNTRFARSIDAAGFLARQDVEEETEPEEEVVEPEEVEEEQEDNLEADIGDIGDAAGALTEQIIGTLTGSAQDVIQLFQEVVQSVGGVLEEVWFFCKRVF